MIMKKILFSLIALMAVMTVQAQSICGTWRTIQAVVATQADNSFSVDSFTFTFNEDGTYNMVNETTESTEPAPTMAMEIALSFDLSGTYTLDGDQLTMTPNIDTYKADVLSISVNGRVSNDPNQINTLKQLVNSPSAKAEFDVKETYTIKVADQMLEMTQEGWGTMQLMRFSTIKN